MSKTPVRLSEEELLGMIDLKVGSKSAEVADGVFKALFEKEKGKMDGRVSKLIYGGIVATALVLVVIVFSTWWFMAGYHQHYLDTQAILTGEISDLEKENAILQAQLKAEMERVRDKQDYLEKLLFDKVEI